MSMNFETANQFFEACETGKGWDECSEYCHSDATFSAQTTALAEITSLEAYCDWMKNLFTPVPDGHYDLKFFAEDEPRKSVAAFAVFHGTQTGPGGPVPGFLLERGAALHRGRAALPAADPGRKTMGRQPAQPRLRDRTPAVQVRAVYRR